MYLGVFQPKFRQTKSGTPISESDLQTGVFFLHEKLLKILNKPY